MTEQPAAPTKAETKSPDPSVEVARLRKENAELSAKIESFQREAELMRAALDTARDEGKLGGLPKSAAQLSESFTIVQDGKHIDARPGDVLLPPDAKVDTIKKNLPAGVRVFAVPAEVIAEVRTRKFARA